HGPPALAQVTPDGKVFWHFESGQVRPLAMSPDGMRLFAVNTPDNHLEIFDVTPGGLTQVASVPVGLEPVAVAARTDTEVWVVNHLSDSISIVDLSSTPARVVRTLLVGDEPRDILFAGTPDEPGDPFPRAFITTTHRGQVHGIGPGGDKYGDFFTPSTGRADVWVFDADDLGPTQGGTPETIVTLFGDTPRALAATPSGDKVYAAVFHSGNKSTISPESGAVTIPNSGVPPSIPTIVQFDGTDWVDNDGNVDTSIQLQLPDTDVFEIDAAAATPVELRGFAGVGTILFNMVFDPTTDQLYVSNTEAKNLVPTEPGLEADIHRARITVIDNAGTVTPRHLNKHINYANPAAGTGDESLATPLEMVIAGDGKLYVAAFGSAKIGVFDTTTLDDGTFVPDDANHIDVTGGGPTGMVLDTAHDRLYVLTRFDNGISIIDRATATETDHLLLHNPEPPSVTDGRPFLYDARFSSTNGEASCASCHVFGRMDDLAWDLGDPNGTIVENPNPFIVNTVGTPEFHPLKGPMVTQSLRGMANHGPMHWRGDRSGALVQGAFDDEDEAFKQFNPAFVGLLGRSAQLSVADMQAFTDFALELAYPPNPIRNLDNSLTPAEASGEQIYTVPVTDGAQTCQGCHTLSPENGFFGSAGFSSFEGASQDMKVAHLRNMYQKVGMFGGVDTTINVGPLAVSTPSHGPADQPQVRGFGYSHSGVVDSLQSFVGISLFNYPGDRAQAINDLSHFLLAFPSELTPIVGQQVTLTSTNGATVGPRIDLLIARAEAAYPSPASPQQMECDLVAQGVVGGALRGWLYDPVNDEFDSDLAGETPLTDAALRALAATTDTLTYTCAPPGSGHRIALDRDLDGLLNFDEVSLHGSNPARDDTDEDGLTDADEVNVHNTNPALADSDGDGLDDFAELNTHGTDPVDADSDDDGLTDGDEIAGGSNPNDAAPDVTIDAPADAARFAPADTISLQGTGLDVEDGDISAAIQWSSDVDGSLGGGASVDVMLSENLHTISASVTDSQGGTRIATVVITVVGMAGDLNDDGEIGVADLLLLQQALTDQRALTTAQALRADLHPVDGDGAIDASDLLTLQSMLAKP
ncbi:MAG: hypothetical protein KJO13_06875, partial [Gammaproteobacteria bacterium]|nr:hypothetical protein [Gammaproteobacteria bacterium]